MNSMAKVHGGPILPFKKRKGYGIFIFFMACMDSGILIRGGAVVQLTDKVLFKLSAHFTKGLDRGGWGSLLQYF